MDVEDWVLHSEPGELFTEYTQRLDLWRRGFGAPVVPSPVGLWAAIGGAVASIVLQAIGGPSLGSVTFSGPRGF